MKRLKKLYFYTLILITLTAIGFLIYPSLSNYINNKFAVSTISDYKETINNKDEDEINSLKERCKTYNKNLFYEDDKAMEETLPFKKGDMIGYIEIPSIKVNLPIYYGTEDSILKKGVGLLEETSIPIGGENTHGVLSAHTGLSNQKLFTDIDKLKEGDLFFIHSLRENLSYKVNQIKIVKPDEVEDLEIKEGEDYITLLTCYPYGVNTERLLVRGERCNISEKIDNTIDKEGNIYAHSNEKLIIVTISLILLLILLLLIFIYIKRKEKRIKNCNNKQNHLKN